MKNYLQQVVFLFLLSLILTNCSSEEEPPVSRVTDETIREDFQAIPLTPGIKDVSLEVAEGVYYNFRVIIPDVDLTQRWPLVMAFHGASNGDPNAHKTTDCLIEPGFADLDAFIVHPNADDNEWYEQENQQKILTLLTLTTSYWPINFGRILATGYSNGGNASWLLAEVASNIFTASIPMASSYDLSVTENTSRKIDIPMYVIHGENDELFPIDVTKKWVDESIAAGSDITFVQADSLTHFKPCDYVPYLNDAVVWLKELWE
jgi:predicted peptidase